MDNQHAKGIWYQQSPRKQKLKQKKQKQENSTTHPEEWLKRKGLTIPSIGEDMNKCYPITASRSVNQGNTVANLKIATNDTHLCM